MSNFLFHKVSKKEKAQIKKQAKKIMDDFSKKLSKLDKQKIPESFIERSQGERKEKSELTTKQEKDFSRETMFKNAPNKNKDFIIAEKKSW